LADKDLNIKIGLDLEINEKAALKKLNDVATKLGTTAEQVMKNLNIEVNVTNIDKVTAKLGRLVGNVSEAQEGLSKFNEDFSMLGALSRPGPGANAFYTRLRDSLGLTEKTNEALTRQLNIRERIAQIVFDDPTQDFSVGRFVRPDNLKVKSYAKGQNNQVEKELKDFGAALEDALSDGLVSERELDDLRESGDLLSASIMEINDAVEEFAFGSGEISDSIKKINNALADAVQVAVVEIKDEFELLPNAVMDKLDSSGKVSEDLQENAIDLSVILNKINNGFVLAEKELDKVKNIKFADVLNEDNVKTGIKPIIDAATFLSAYNQALLENPLPTVGIGNIKREDKLKASKYEAKQFPKGVEQASDKVIDSFVEKLEKVVEEPGGEDRARRRFEEIQTIFFDDLLQRALTRANSASAEKFNKFEEDPVFGYAPNAMQPAKSDTENLRRYVDEGVARFIYEEMLRAGLHPSTFAALAPSTFSKKFGENMGVSEGGPAGYNVQDVLNAARSASFPTGIGRQGIQISPSAAGDLSVPAATFSIVNQILSNPAILKKLTSVTPPTLESRKDQAFAELTASNNGYPWKGIMKEATDLAYAIRFVERIKEEKLDKPSPNDLARQRAAAEAKAAASAPLRPQIDIASSIARFQKQQENENPVEKTFRTREEKAADKAYGEGQAKLIAQRRDRIRKDAEAFDKAWDEAHAEEAARSSGAPVVVESKPEIKTNVQKRVAKKVEAVEKQIDEAAAEQVASAPFSVASQPIVEQPAVARSKKQASYDMLAQEQLLQGGNLAVGIDTEYYDALNQGLTEISLVFRNIEGQFVNLFDFIHIPRDLDTLAQDPFSSNAKNPEQLAKRAAAIGLDPSSLGSTTDELLNKKEQYDKAKNLIDVLDNIQQLGITLTGSSLANAEARIIKQFINDVNSFAEEIGEDRLPQPNIMAKVFDTAKAFGKLDRNSELASGLPSTKGGKAEVKLQTIMQMIGKDYRGWFDQFSGIGQIGKEGLTVTSRTGAQMEPHYAQTDAIASLIAMELFKKFAPPAVSTTVIPATKTKDAGDGGKPPAQPPAASAADDPMGERKANALARAFHSQYEYTKMLSGLTTDETNVITRRLDLLKQNDKQIALSAELLEKERAIADKRKNLQGMPAGPDYQATRKEIEALDTEINKLIETGRKNEAGIKQQVIEEGRNRDVKEELRDNDRKGIDLEIKKAHASKQFAAQIQAQLKAELEAQKAVQKANREQLNQWVTARYALYDVGNFYQNVAQQMFRLSKEIFNTTQTFRSFESAFTSVERAMQLPADAAVDMRDQFIKLSETLPVTFEDLSRIATLGAQMGIGAGGIEDFTSTVARFSAITTISAETVAQKFGRIAELANIDSSQFENLGSAVAFAGVNAVATENEILTLSESIAAVSEMAGFMPSETIGMATALASVGIQAEQARGVFTRVFADIDRSVSRGGSELDAFAKISGMSSEAFAKQWGTEGQSYQVFRKLLGGLGSSADATKAFDALNIVETREINTLIRLAENLNVVDQAVSDSNESFADATFLASSFGKTADNLDAQLVIFKNNIDSLVVSITQSLGPGLAWTLEKASGFLEVLKSASKSGAAQAFLPLALAITGIGAGFAATAAGISKMIAQIYAFRVANINSMNSSATEITSFSGKVKQLTGAYSDLIEVRSGLSGAAGPDVRGTITPINYNARDIFAGQRAAFADFIKNRDFASARQIMNSTRENALLQNANILMISANEKQGVSIALARQQADAVQRIIDARRQEIAALAQKGALEGVSEAQMLAEKFYVEITQQGAVAVSASEVAKLKETAANNTLAVSERQLATARLANIKAVNAETATATRGARMGMTGVLNRATGILGFVGIVATAVSMVDMLRVSIEEANKLDLMASGGGVQSLRDAMAEDTKVWRETKEAINVVQVEYTAFEKVTYDAYDAIISVAGANDKLKESTNEVTEVVKSQTVAIGENTKNWILNSIIGNEKVNEWLKSNPGLFNDAEAALQSYGTSFSKLINNILKNPTEGLTSAIAQIDGSLDELQRRAQKRLDEFYRNNADAGSSNNIVNPDDDPVLGPFIARIEAQKAGLKGIKTLLKELATAIRLGLDTSAIRKSLEEALGGGLEDIVKESTTKASKTLSQWSSEVAQIIQSALTIRRQKQVGLDGITKAWSDLRKRADDARKAVKKAQDQINGLTANRGTLEYQLNIAIKYGDSKRAAELQAKLDENTTSLAEANDQLKEAQDAASTELKGNSDAAIENRSKLRSLVDTYVPYIQALENSTVKGETFAQKQDRIAKRVAALKNEFIAQAKELGFAEKDLAAYIGDFDAMATVVRKMPNTVTVKIDGLPAALRALKEFAVNANNELGKINLNEKAIDSALISGYDDKIKILRLQAQATNDNKGLSAAGKQSSLSVIGNSIKYYLDEIKKLKSKTYATGGFVSGPGTPTSDSIPAMLSNGEYVVKASTVRKVGVSALNDLNQNASVAKFAGGGYVDSRDGAAGRRAPTKLQQWAGLRMGRLWGNSDWLLDGKKRFGLTDAQMQAYIKSQQKPATPVMVQGTPLNKNNSVADLQLRALANDKNWSMEAARTAAYFTPFIGSVLSASDASRAFGAKDILGGGLSALGTIPGIGGFLKLAGLAGKGSKAGSALGNAGDKVFKYGVDKPAEWISKILSKTGGAASNIISKIPSFIDKYVPKLSNKSRNLPNTKDFSLEEFLKDPVAGAGKLNAPQSFINQLTNPALQRSEPIFSLFQLLKDAGITPEAVRKPTDISPTGTLGGGFSDKGVYDLFKGKTGSNFYAERMYKDAVIGQSPSLLSRIFDAPFLNVKTQLSEETRRQMANYSEGLAWKAYSIAKYLMPASERVTNSGLEPLGELFSRAIKKPYASNDPVWDDVIELYTKGTGRWQGWQDDFFQTGETIQATATPGQIASLRQAMNELAGPVDPEAVRRTPLTNFLDQIKKSPDNADTFKTGLTQAQKNVPWLQSLGDLAWLTPERVLSDLRKFDPDLGSELIDTLEKLRVFGHNYGTVAQISGASSSPMTLFYNEAIPILKNNLLKDIGAGISSNKALGNISTNFIRLGPAGNISRLKYEFFKKDAGKFKDSRALVEQWLTTGGLFHGTGKRGKIGSPQVDAMQREGRDRGWHNLYAGNLFSTSSRNLANLYSNGDPANMYRLGLSPKALAKTRALNISPNEPTLSETDPKFLKDVLRMFEKRRTWNPRAKAAYEQELNPGYRTEPQADEITNIGLNSMDKAEKAAFIRLMRKYGYNSMIHSSTHHERGPVAFWVDVPKGIKLFGEEAFPSDKGLPPGFIGRANGGLVTPKYFSQGGLAKGTDTVPAMLSPGEFIMSAGSVSNYGVDFMNAMNQSRVMYAPAQPSMAQSGGGSSVVYLSPDDRALLRAAIDRPVNLYADSTRLAQSVNNGNKVLAQRGSI
jgi:TP901 family phage tail tape measure protein